VPWLRENMALLCETHSHNTMNAFFSGTDDANENATQFYGVWGYVTKDEPAFAFRYVCGDQKIQITPDVLFDWPKKVVKTIEVTEVEGQEPIQVVKEEKVELLKGPFEHVDYPEDWMPQHSKSITIVTPSYSRGAYGAGAGTGSNYGKTGGAGARRDYQSSIYDYDYPYGAGHPAEDAYDEEDFYARFRKAEMEEYGRNHAGSKESHGKKLEVNPREVGNESLASADVVEIHTAADFANLRVVENEAKDIGEDLRDYGFDGIIESAIDAVDKEGLDKKAN
jgi:hypothetical protein